MKNLLYVFLCILACTCNPSNKDVEDQNFNEINNLEGQFAVAKGSDFFYCVCDASTSKGLSWDYPIKPGSEEWKQLQSHLHKVFSCLIPNVLLPSLSTAELTAICLQYPLLFNILAFNDINQGFDTAIEEFNGLKELFNRADVSTELLKWYNCQIKNFSLLTDEMVNDFDKVSFMTSLSLLEILLTRVEDKYKEVLQSLVDGYERKLEYEHFFSGKNMNINYFSRAHIILNFGEQYLLEILGLSSSSYFGVTVVPQETKDAINRLSYQLKQ